MPIIPFSFGSRFRFHPFSFKKACLFIIPVFFAGLASCDIMGSGPCLQGKGAIKTEARDLPPFKGVDLRVPGTVILTPGPSFEVSIRGFQNILPEIITELSGTTLVIRSTSCLEYSNKDATISITLPEIDLLELKSSGDIKVQNVSSYKPLKLALSGSGSLNYMGSVLRLEVSHSGSGDLLLEGSARYLQTTLSGAGRVLGYSMPTDSAKILVTGSGLQKVQVREYLEASLTGSGNVFYKGRPGTLTTNSSGSGRVISEN